jgi:hypothetical protein
MMPEVRNNPLSQTFGLILCRFHQGYIPARAFSLKFGRVTALIVSGRVSPSCRFVGELSITAMVIPAPSRSSVQQMLSFSPRIRHLEPDGLSG